MKNTIRTVLAVVLLLAGFGAGRCEADVVILGTRIIFPAAQTEVTVMLSNTASRPALVQLWVDEDGVSAAPSTSKAPFMVTPPLARMEGDKGQVVRVLRRPSALPTDRESLFWFNMLEVPPKPQTGAEQNLMQFAVKTRIKLIYRPEGLPGESADAPRQLSWSLAEDARALRVHNPTPYYVNFASIGVRHGDEPLLERPEGGGKVAPGETAILAFPGLASLRHESLKVVFTALSDVGSPIALTQAIAL